MNVLLQFFVLSVLLLVEVFSVPVVLVAEGLSNSSISCFCLSVMVLGIFSFSFTCWLPLNEVKNVMNNVLKILHHILTEPFNQDYIHCRHDHMCRRETLKHKSLKHKTHFLVGLFTERMPLPLNSSESSGCVPEGIFMVTMPSRVNTSTDPPKIACVIRYEMIVLHQSE